MLVVIQSQCVYNKMHLKIKKRAFKPDMCNFVLPERESVWPYSAQRDKSIFTLKPVQCFQ